MYIVHVLMLSSSSSASSSPLRIIIDGSGVDVVTIDIVFNSYRMSDNASREWEPQRLLVCVELIIKIFTRRTKRRKK